MLQPLIQFYSIAIIWRNNGVINLAIWRNNRLGKNGNCGIVKDIEKCKQGLKRNLDKNDIINIDVKEWVK